MARRITLVVRRVALMGAMLSVLAGPVEPVSGAPPATSSEGPIELRYGVASGRLKVADAALRIEPDAETIRSELTVESRGLVALLSGIRTEMDAVSRKLPDGGIAPERFRALYAKTDRTREIQIRYEDGGQIAAVDLTNQGRPQESEVPVELQQGTVDPLTAFLEVRAWLAEVAQGRAAPRTVVPVFDGRKRFDLEASFVRRTRWSAATGEVPALELKVRLLARFGFDPDDTLMTFPDDPDGRWLKVLASDEVLPVLLRAETVEKGRSSVIELTHE